MNQQKQAVCLTNCCVDDVVWSSLGITVIISQPQLTVNPFICLAKWWICNRSYIIVKCCPINAQKLTRIDLRLCDCTKTVFWSCSFVQIWSACEGFAITKTSVLSATRLSGGTGRGGSVNLTGWPWMASICLWPSLLRKPFGNGYQLLVSFHRSYCQVIGQLTNNCIIMLYHLFSSLRAVFEVVWRDTHRYMHECCAFALRLFIK